MSVSGTAPSGTAPRPVTAAARATDLSEVFGEGETRVVALDGVSVAFGRGEYTAIMGPSGSGKSTRSGWTRWSGSSACARRARPTAAGLKRIQDSHPVRVGGSPDSPPGSVRTASTWFTPIRLRSKETADAAM